MLTHRKVVTLFQALYNTVSWNSDNGNARNNEVGQCLRPLTGRRLILGRIRRGVDVASFSFSSSLPASSSEVGARCRIMWTCSGSDRSATWTCSGKHGAFSGESSRLLQRLHFSFCTDRSWL